MRTRVKYQENWNKEIMTKNEFCWWLHGFMEISKTKALTKEEVQEIKNHLHLVINPQATYPKTLGQAQTCGTFNSVPFDGLITC